MRPDITTALHAASLGRQLVARLLADAARSEPTSRYEEALLAQQLQDHLGTPVAARFLRTRGWPIRAATYLLALPFTHPNSTQTETQR